MGSLYFCVSGLIANIKHKPNVVERISAMQIFRLIPFFRYLKTSLYCIVILFFTGCRDNTGEHYGFQSGDKVSVRAENGLYICTDRYNDNLLIGNRLNAGDWEVFQLEFRENGFFCMGVSEGVYVGILPSGSQLAARTGKEDLSVWFEWEARGSGVFYIRDYRGKYIRIDSKGFLFADAEVTSEAGVFTIRKIPPAESYHYTFVQRVPLVISLLLVFASLLTFHFGFREWNYLLLLLMGGFAARLFTSLLYPYLHLWDEQFHALVAANMVDHPWVPMLYRQPLLPFPEHSWTEGHIWLHKQPLFLWQMALSIRFFGENEFAVRLPSLLMSTGVIYFIYRTGSLTAGKEAGFYGAILFSLSAFSLEIAAGAIHTDHNDVAFLFYVAASVWDWTEYEFSSGKRKWVFMILTGFFAGGAVLNKWLTGLLVFAGWGLSILFVSGRRKEKSHYLYLMVSFLVCLVVFLPWQIYILRAFPELSRFEYNYNTRHFFHVLEGHGGGFGFHFSNATELYGVGMVVIAPAIVALIYTLRSRVFRIALPANILIVYLFYTLAKTKMIAFSYSVSFLVYLALGSLVVWLLRWVFLNPAYFPRTIHTRIFALLVVGLLTGMSLNPDKIRKDLLLFRKDKKSLYFKRYISGPFVKNLSKDFDNPGHTVVFNCLHGNSVPVMFYNKVAAAYGYVPDKQTLLTLKRDGYRIAVIEEGPLPDYILNDSEVLVLKNPDTSGQ